MRQLLLSLFVLNACRANPYIALQLQNNDASSQTQEAVSAINEAFGCELVKVGPAQNVYHSVKLVLNTDTVVKDYPNDPQVEGWYDGMAGLIALKAFNKCTKTDKGYWTSPCDTIGDGKPNGSEDLYVTSLQHELGHVMGFDHVEGTIMQAVGPRYSATEGAKSLAELYSKTFGVDQCAVE